MAIYEAYTKAADTGKDGKIVLREEQKDAVKKALAVFKKPFTEKMPYHKFLWNAKMRFGKTLCAMQLAKEMGVKRTLIVTHRPVVDASWHDDFDKIFEHDSHYRYGNRFDESSEGDFDELEKFADKAGNHYVFFVSMQFLRRSNLVNDEGLNNLLKAKILNNHWDLVVVDEAHEGTLTFLGSRVIDHLSKPKTCVLHLSGTPFNLYDDFGEGEIFTWDYIKEQREKREWPVNHPGEPNPYADLPQMKIYTYDIGTLVRGAGEGKVNGVFMFSEFFRTWTGNTKKDRATMPANAKGRFVHEKSVKEFLDLLCKEDPKSNYPFSTQEYQENFKHTLWVVPGVAAAKALEKLLHEHEIFVGFKVVNVAGESEDEEIKNALAKVREAIKDNDYTITISCGRLTTGVTVPEWTAVFYMKGSENTNASTYLQTIFRVQTPHHTSDGRMKAKAYVFDFAPDRSLKMLAEVARFSAKTTGKDKLLASKIADQKELEAMKELLEFCPVIAYDGSEMKQFEDEQELFAKLAEAKIDRVVKRGFDDTALYNVEELLKMDPDAVNQLLNLLGKTPGTKAATKIDLKKTGLAGKGAGKCEKDTGSGDANEEDAETKAAKKAAKKERDNRIAILRGVSLRIPLLIFGAEVTDESTAITVDNFTKVIDDESWVEFMPRNFTKEEFEKIKVCYDRVTFVESGKRYRQLAREADFYSIEDRIKAITTIFSYFHNPDKETVLTPWRVVNMHMSDTIGGWCFFNDQFDGPNLKEVTSGSRKGELVETTEPRWVEQKDVTKAIFQQADKNGDTPVRILEINSKTGLYPLYVTYSLYRSILPIWKETKGEDGVLLLAEEQALWDKILQDNIFVICNTPMAARITERTLRGFRKVDGMHIKDIKLVEEATKDQAKLVKKLNSKTFWSEEGEGEMKFNAIVGNPPYQVMDGGSKASARPVYNVFVGCAKALKPNYISMIMPSRWFSGGKGLDEFRTEMFSDKGILSLTDIFDAKECFPTATISGGVCYFLRDRQAHDKCLVTNIVNGRSTSLKRSLNEYPYYIRYNQSLSIIRKINAFESVSAGTSLSSVISSRNPFGISTSFRGRKAHKDGDVLVLGSGGYQSYIAKKELVAGFSSVDKWKLMICRTLSGHTGETDRNGQFTILSTMKILAPNEVCTDSFVIGGVSKKKNEVINFHAYLKTKFVRFLIAQTLSSLNLSREAYSIVPIQDFNKPWTDAELYKKYKLTKEEIAFIESMIKPME